MLEAHVLAIVILGVSSFIIGSIPVKLSRCSEQPFLVSLLLCFGGGVLLATSVIHMLSEVRGKLSELSELIFCAGFLLLYAVDELTHLCIKDVHSADHNSRSTSARTSRQISTSSSDGLFKNSEIYKHQTNYGTIDKLPTRARFDSISKSFQPDVDVGYGSIEIPTQSTSYNFDEDQKCCKKHRTEANILRATWKNQQDIHSSAIDELDDCSECESSTDISQTSDLCHVEVKKPCSQSKSSLFGLLSALLLHSILEGCSIGVQSSSAEVLLILAAVACHKLVLAFCFGLELSSAGYDGFLFLVLLGVFSVGCPIGIVIGASLTHTSTSVFVVEAPLQALAAGSLLYVAVFEVLPRERYKWQHKRDFKTATFFQMIAVLLGFTFITFLSFFGDYHGHGPKPIPAHVDTYP